MASVPPSQAPEGVPEPGTVLAGKYRVERVLGAGGMGIVVAATHLLLDERVALKFLLPTMISAETSARFAREARAAAKIKSEHVARVSDVGTLESGSPYIVMEYLDGSDLAAVVRQEGPLPVRTAAEYLLQACDAVAEAHALGIVHRDLKPTNLFLARRKGGQPIVKVLDFGISKLSAQGPTALEDPSMTRTRAWLGSPVYMSPEQMRSARDVDARSDIWSLGVILFELLTGKVPFDASTFPELCALVLHGAPADLAELRPDAPPALGDVVRKCFEKDPARRYASIGELAMALVPFAPSRARSVAERAVSVAEASGLMRSSGAPRIALDATLPEHLGTPFPRGKQVEAHSSRPPSMPPPSGATPAPRRSVSDSLRPGSPVRFGLVATVAAAAVVFASLGVYIFLRRGASEASTETIAATAAASAIPPGEETAAPSAPASVVAAADVVASAAPAPTDRPAASGAPSSLPVSQPAQGIARPALPSSKPVATSAPATPTPPAADDAAHTPAPAINKELGAETCTQHLPDGTTVRVPCAKATP